MEIIDDLVDNDQGAPAGGDAIGDGIHKKQVIAGDVLVQLVLGARPRALNGRRIPVIDRKLPSLKDVFPLNQGTKSQLPHSADRGAGRQGLILDAAEKGRGYGCLQLGGQRVDNRHRDRILINEGNAGKGMGTAVRQVNNPGGEGGPVIATGDHHPFDDDGSGDQRAGLVEEDVGHDQIPRHFKVSLQLDGWSKRERGQGVIPAHRPDRARIGQARKCRWKENIRDQGRYIDIDRHHVLCPAAREGAGCIEVRMTDDPVCPHPGIQKINGWPTVARRQLEAQSVARGIRHEVHAPSAQSPGQPADARQAHFVSVAKTRWRDNHQLVAKRLCYPRFLGLVPIDHTRISSDRRRVDGNGSVFPKGGRIRFVRLNQSDGVHPRAQTGNVDSRPPRARRQLKFDALGPGRIPCHKVSPRAAQPSRQGAGGADFYLCPVAQPVDARDLKQVQHLQYAKCLGGSDTR